MITLRDWELNKEKWLDKDLALMQSDEGWRERTQKKGIKIFKTTKMTFLSGEFQKLKQSILRSLTFLLIK